MNQEFLSKFGKFVCRTNQDLLSKFRKFIPENIPSHKYHKLNFDSKELDFPQWSQDMTQRTTQKYSNATHSLKNLTEIRSIVYANLSVR